MERASERDSPRFPLAGKLLLGLLAVAGVMLAFLLLWFGPRTSRSFLDRCDELIARSSQAMREMSHASATSSKQVLVNLIRHTADARRRTLSDLPLSLYAGDVERMRGAIEQVDERRSRRLEKNVDLLAREMESRAARRIEEHLAQLTREQAALGALFAEDVRQSYLVLSGVLLAALLVLMGAGLYRLVVRPVRSLRRATHAVAGGDLEVTVDVASRDEIGALSSDFATMVQQLRESRAELTELNRNLESEVERKTEHLQRALADLQQTQSKLVLAEKMASVGTLAGGVAHEFNNLIGGIRGCAAEALADEPDAERREPLEVILRATSRGADITDQLLRFARLRVEGMRPTDLGPVIEDARRLVEPDARRLRVDLECRLDSELSVRGDSQALHQVVLNLLRNALQAMPDGGTLTVEAEASPEEVTVRVRDTGTGIAKEELGQVFDPFFTTKDQAKDPFLRGSGLGLSVSYGIVEAHGGTIEVTSSVGEGSVFTVRLPRPTGMVRNGIQGTNGSA